MILVLHREKPKDLYEVGCVIFIGNERNSEIIFVTNAVCIRTHATERCFHAFFFTHTVNDVQMFVHLHTYTTKSVYNHI